MAKVMGLELAKTDTRAETEAKTNKGVTASVEAGTNPTSGVPLAG